MEEERFDVTVDGVVLRGHRGGSGAPALLLHGGAAVPDYLGECAKLLDGLFSTIRYTQRGTPPSDEGPPYSVERHVADALAVLDAFELERAWAIGHSWGGHLALHLLVAHPERLLGVLCIDPLGADPTIFGEYEANLARGLTEEQIARPMHFTDPKRGAADFPLKAFLIGWAQHDPIHTADMIKALPELSGDEALASWLANPFVRGYQTSMAGSAPA